MTIAFVLGNGISRKGLGLNGLRPYGKIYGCNSLYTEFEPNVLVATDKPISARIQDLGYATDHVFYTRKPVTGSGALTIPKQYYGFSSGPAAAGIAAIDQNQQIYLIGFDCGPTPDQFFNNIYAGTEFYKPPTSLPTFTGNWMKRNFFGNSAGALVDSIVFPTIAFGALMPAIVAAQFAAKVLGGTLWGYLIKKKLDV